MLALTQQELSDLVEFIAIEVGRQMKSSPKIGQDSKPQDGSTTGHASATAQKGKSGAEGNPCGHEACPHNSAPRAAVEARAVTMTSDVRKLASLIDHTLLRPEATGAEIEQLANEAALMGCAAVCVNPAWVSLAAERLRGSGVKVATVVGFPLGATLTSAKRAEAEAAILAGAEEVDMVMNVGAMRSGDTDRVESDIRGVAETCRAGGALLKVILENAFLSDQQKTTACQIVKRTGAEYVKTSTGFGPSGAIAADIRLMREAVGPEMGVKAAGGIRTLADMLRMLEAGATRIGASASAAILAEASRIVS